MSIESVMQSNHLILYRPLLLLPSFFLSIRVFSNESVLCIRWPKYWSFSFSISPSNEYSGLISFRIDWLDLLQSKVIFSIINFFLFLTWNAFYFLIFANFHTLSSLRSSAFSSVKSLQMLWAPISTFPIWLSIALSGVTSYLYLTWSHLATNHSLYLWLWNPGFSVCSKCIWWLNLTWAMRNHLFIHPHRMSIYIFYCRYMDVFDYVVLCKTILWC